MSEETDQKNSAAGVRWDLSDLYGGPDDLRIKRDLGRANAFAGAFEKKYRGRLEGFSKKRGGKKSDFARLLRDYEAIVELVTKPMVFAHLRFAEKTDDPARGAFLQSVRTRVTEIRSKTLFWEIFWTRLDPKKAAAVMKSPGLAARRHYLSVLRNHAPHTLTEPEEKILSFKSNTSDGAFSRLFDETVNGIAFTMTENGVPVKKTESEILAFSHSPDRDLRRRASEALAQGLAGQSRILTYTYNMILADHRLALKLRKFKHPSDPRNLANETDLKTVRNLIGSVKNRYPLVGRFYRLKARLLGLDQMLDYDRYAPIAAEEERVEFDRCRGIVLDGYREFSEPAGRIAEEFFSKRWIDAEIREGKQGGGFSSETTPELHPYILVNYTGTMRDVMTVAHELGHGIHQYLARKAGILESGAPLTMAETASVFGEMLIFDRILSGEPDPARRLNLLCGKIDDHFATVFRQIALTDFEWSAHEAGLKKGELDAEVLSDMWIAANSAMVGTGVRLTDAYRQGWKYIPHFVHTPFYCYAYAFAQLFVLCLFQKYREDKKLFPEKFMKMLEWGGSRRPDEIAAVAGINLRRGGLWESGLDLLEELVAQAEGLASSVKISSKSS